MRRIKFRTWDKSRNSWLYGWQFRDLGYFLNDKDIIVMQFTGLKDIHDKEIYEGDIIKIIRILDNAESQEFYEKAIFKVIFEDGAFRAQLIHNDNYYLEYYLDECCAVKGGECEVIGNIYENKELLNEQSI